MSAARGWVLSACGYVSAFGGEIKRVGESRCRIRPVAERAQVAGGPVVNAHAEALTACDVIDEKWERDKATYGEACADVVHEALTARGVTVAVEVVDGTADAGEWVPLLDELQERARMAAALRIVQREPGVSRDEPARRLGRP